MSRWTSSAFLCLLSWAEAAALAEVRWEASRLSRWISLGARVVVVVIMQLLCRARTSTTWIEGAVYCTSAGVHMTISELGTAYDR